FRVDEIWRLPESTFKNRGAVLIGSKVPALNELPDEIPGYFVNELGVTPLTFHRHVQGNRTAWSEQAVVADEPGFFDPAGFKQGADIMPRTLWFHEVEPVPASRGTSQSRLRRIDPKSSRLGFLVKEAKKFDSFAIS